MEKHAAATVSAATCSEQTQTTLCPAPSSLYSPGHSACHRHSPPCRKNGGGSGGDKDTWLRSTCSSVTSSSTVRFTWNCSCPVRHTASSDSLLGCIEESN